FAHNGQISVRIQRRSQNAAKVGIIFRQTLERNSAQGGMFFSGDKILFERSPDGKSPSIVTVKTNDSAQWLRVVREGPAVSGFYSTDGTNWIAIAADTVAMPENIFLGFAVSGSGSAEITNLRITSAYLKAPQPGTKLLVPTNILLEANVAELHERKSTVEFFSVPRRITKITEAPYQFLWTNVLSGANSFLAKVTDETGAEFFTESVEREIKLSLTAARFLRLDSVTQGNWKTNYGGEGFVIANHQTNLPPYVQWISTGFHPHMWLNLLTEERCLMRVESQQRIASSWFHPKQLEIDLTLADGNPHRFAIYFLDWDGNDRSTLVEVINPSDNKKLDSQIISSFSNGKYLGWSLTGHVKIKITAIKGNASISGLFFDSESEKQ
ncbi:MAG: hypothetical protein ABI042_05420, partial [Verrucomicrobiota bacterium]